MSRGTGFFPLRRGLWEHLRDGRLNHLEALAFIYICTQADTRTGVWIGSAGALAGELNLKPRTARDLIENLTTKTYLTRFPVPGRHVCYPILVHKFLITNGEHSGEQLNAIDSASPTDLVHFPREQTVEPDDEQSVQQNVKRGASQRRSKTRELKSEKREALRTCEVPASNNQSENNSRGEKISRSREGKQTRAPKKSFNENLAMYIEREGFTTVSEFLTYNPKTCGSNRSEWELRAIEFKIEWTRACDSLGYKLDLADPLLTWEFVDEVVLEVEKRKEQNITPARICMKILDRCQRKSPTIPYPPSFLVHKNKLYEAEKLSA